MRHARSVRFSRKARLRYENTVDLWPIGLAWKDERQANARNATLKIATSAGLEDGLLLVEARGRCCNNRRFMRSVDGALVRCLIGKRGSVARAASPPTCRHRELAADFRRLREEIETLFDGKRTSISGQGRPFIVGPDCQLPWSGPTISRKLQQRSERRRVSLPPVLARRGQVMETPSKKLFDKIQGRRLALGKGLLCVRERLHEGLRDTPLWITEGGGMYGSGGINVLPPSRRRSGIWMSWVRRPRSPSKFIVEGDGWRSLWVDEASW